LGTDFAFGTDYGFFTKGFVIAGLGATDFDIVVSFFALVATVAFF